MHPGSIRQSGLLFHVGYESTFPGVSPQGEGRQEEIQSDRHANTRNKWLHPNVPAGCDAPARHIWVD